MSEDVAGTLDESAADPDICGRMNVESAMRQSEDRYARLFAGVPVGLAVRRQSDGHYLDANPAFLRLLGYARDDLVGQLHDELGIYAEEARSTVLDKLNGLVPSEPFGARMRTRAGETVYTFTAVEKMVLDGVPCLVTMALDVTGRKNLEKSLRESERTHRQLYDHSPDMYLSGYSADFLIHECNLTLLETLGYTKEEVVGRHWQLLFEPHSYQRVMDALPTYLEMKRYDNLDVQLLRKDGTHLDALMSGKLDEEPPGGAAYSRITFRDVTERRRAELALAESEARLRAVIENTGDAVWSIDRSYRLLVANSSFTRISERRFGHVFSPGDSMVDAPFTDELMRTWRSAYDRALAGESFTFQLESPDANGLAFEFYFNPIRATTGAITGVVVRAVDITARLHSEARMRDTLARLAMATVTASIGVWTFDLVSGTLEWDDRMCEMYAVEGDVCSNGRFLDIWHERIHPDDLATAEPWGATIGLIPSRWDGAFRIILPDGAIRHIRASAVTEYDRHGTPVRVLGINQDITEQKLFEQMLQDTNVFLEQRVQERTCQLADALEELKAADRMKDEFLAAMSHELRTPLSGILGAADSLLEQLYDTVTPRQQRQLNTVQASGERLLKMVNELLRYATLTAGKATIWRERCSLNEIGEASISKVRRMAAAKYLTVEYAISEPSPVIIGDAEGIMDMLNDLLDNAVKFTPEGGSIGLEIGDAGDTVQLVVWDTGIGIAPEKRAHIFAPFVQGDGGLSRRYEGMGLGLAYVAKLAAAMGGTVSVESEAGKGSRFTLTLPRK